MKIDCDCCDTAGQEGHPSEIKCPFCALIIDGSTCSVCGGTGKTICDCRCHLTEQEKHDIEVEAMIDASINDD